MRAVGVPLGPFVFSVSRGACPSRTGVVLHREQLLLKSILKASCFLSKDCLSFSRSVSWWWQESASSSMIAKMPAEVVADEVVAEGVVKVGR